MGPTRASEGEGRESSDVEFFGVKLKVSSPHLAALLNSGVHEDVRVLGQRARDAFSADEGGRAGGDPERRLQDADGSGQLAVGDTTED